VVWRTFVLAPDAPLEGRDKKEAWNSFPGRNDEVLRKAREGLMALARAADAPLNIDASTVIPNTLKAHRLVHLASRYELGEAAIDAVFAALWVEGVNIGETAPLLSIAEQLGLDPQETADVLANTDFSDLLAMHQAAAKVGVQGVPVAIFNRRQPVFGAASVEEYKAAIEGAI
jgi:predicted DsbA family dithiol-disulfide isomerase